LISSDATPKVVNFADHVGVPAVQYLVRWRLQLAARRLEEPGVTVSQAGADFGYAARFRRLGDLLNAKGDNPTGLTVIRFIILSGFRRHASGP
jgi:methylphosphotriester-DNA--protein-cysteine methyltransferase